MISDRPVDDNPMLLTPEDSGQDSRLPSPLALGCATAGSFDLLDGTGNSQERVPGFSQQAQSQPLYTISSRFLREAYESLTQTPDEGLIYVTGPKEGENIFVLSRLVKFQPAHVSQAHAEPDPLSQGSALERLTDEGQALLATFHSHPGNGADATHPSGTDLATQDQLEQLSYPTIGAIFSRDGYVRFYSKNREFQVSVSGSGCELVAENVFRISGTRSSSKLNGRNS